jgi:outer membrane protein assembly factor BamB
MQKFLKQSFRLLLLPGALSLGLMCGCGGPLKYRDLRPDPNILRRDWTLATHGPFEIGDHGTEFSNPVILENTLVFGNQSRGLVSLYPRISQKRWDLAISGGVISELTTDHGVAYFGGGDGFLYAVDLENGRVNWKYELKNPIVSRPTVSQGRVFVTTTDDTIYAFDAGTGKWLWHYRRRSSPIATIYGASAPLVDKNEVLAGLSDGFLVTLSVEDGTLKWEKKLHFGTRFTDVNAHPVLVNGVIYIPSYDGSLYALGRQKGDVIWRFDAGGSKEVVVEGSRIFLPSSEGSIYAIQKDTSKVLWKFELDSGVPTQLIVTDKYIIFGSSFQYLYVVDKNTGMGLYRFNVGYGNGFYGSPAYDSERQKLYFLSTGGNLYAFSLTKPPRKARPHGTISPFEF